MLWSTGDTLLPSGGLGKLSSAHRTMVEIKMIVPARFRKMAARCHNPRRMSRGRGHRYLGISIRKPLRSEEHTSELQSLMRNSYADFFLKKKNTSNTIYLTHII